MRVRVVSRENLNRVSGEAWVDPTRRPFVQNGLAYIPVREGYQADQELPERQEYRSGRYFMIGDIAVIHGARPSPQQVSGIVSWKNPRGVVHVSSSEGTMRLPKTEVLYGSLGETCHREGGITYRIDPSRVMFAMGNREEKARISALIRPGERVADMCAGIGYFSLPMAREKARVDAWEINPDSYRFLLANIRENSLDTLIQPYFGDSRDNLQGVYDRVVIGHFDSQDFIHSLTGHVKPGSMVHCHTLSDDPLPLKKPFMEAGYDIRTTLYHVKKYRPHIWHNVVDCEVIGYADA